MRIKKKNHNEYLQTEADVWVRNPYKVSPRIDINELASSEDYQMFLKNEHSNKLNRMRRIDTTPIEEKNVVIISDGLNFEESKHILAKLPYKDVCVIGVNRTLAKWTDMVRGENKRSMNYYVINNPTVEAMNFYPTEHTYFPRCIASSRTYPRFVGRYPGPKILYIPTNTETYCGPFVNATYTIDDYRNPICGAIGLAHRFGVKKLVLLNCDDSFKEDRPASVQLENEMWCYPQQIKAHNIIDAFLYWLRRGGVQIKHCSDGPNFKSAEYISLQEIPEFFRGQDV